MRTKKNIPTLEEWWEEHTFYVDDELWVTDTFDGVEMAFSVYDLMESMKPSEILKIYRDIFDRDPGLRERLLNAPHWTDEEREKVRAMCYGVRSGKLQ